MGYYNINGGYVPEGDSYFEVADGTFGAELRPRAAYQTGFYRGMMLTQDFWRYYGENAQACLPDVGVLQTRGKSIYIGGDSLHAYAGGDGKTTIGFVTDWNRHFGANVTNAGYAGSKWSETTGGGGVKRVTDLVAAGKPYDVFILAWGTNDDAGGDGTIEDEASNAEGCTMVAAMKWCITQLRSTFPRSAIGVIIPPPRYSNEGLDQRADLMLQVCQLLHVPYVDMRVYLSMEDMGSDAVHLGGGGSVKYGAAEAKLILDICPYGEPLQAE